MKDFNIFKWNLYWLRKNLYDYFRERRCCYALTEIKKEIAFAEFEKEVALLVLFCTDPDCFEAKDRVSRMSSKLPDRAYDVLEEYNRLYYSNEKMFGKYVFLRVCCDAGRYKETEKILLLHVSETVCEETYTYVSNCINFYSDGFMTERETLFLGILFLSLVFLFLAQFENWDASFYTFMKCLVSVSLFGMLLERIPVWLKFAAMLLLILYNPICPIHLGERELWVMFNWGTIVYTIIAKSYFIIKTGVRVKNGIT